MTRALAPLLALLVPLSAACKEKPLARAIVGTWEHVCTTDEESASTCLGPDGKQGLTKEFRADGTIVGAAKGGSTMTGRWILTGDELELAFEGGGLVLRERYTARIENGNLVLWYIRGEFGTIYVRSGTRPVFREGAATRDGAVRHRLSGIGYRLTLPGEYRLARDDNDRQRWDPRSGEGYRVLLTVGPRSKTSVNGVFVTPPCDDDPPGVSGSSGTVDGVERDLSIGIHHCMDGTERYFACSVEHTRGWLETSDEEPALAICRSLTIDAGATSSAPSSLPSSTPSPSK